MAHSKRNTSLAFFTNFERSQLKDRWGSQKARLTRESFVPLAGCHLCLQTAREPVACRDGGHTFCRECAMTNLLTQKKEIQRLEKEEERRQTENEEHDKEKADEAQEEAVRDFERTMMGLEPDAAARNRNKRKSEAIVNDGEDGREASRRKVDAGKGSNSAQNFWMPVSSETANEGERTSIRKQRPICPSGSSKDTHPFSLKGLIAVNFTTSASGPTSSDPNTATTEVNGHIAAITCPSCKKGLSASSKAILTVPCGHVICKACVEKFMRVSTPASGDNLTTPTQTEEPLACYVCQTHLTATGRGKVQIGSKKSKVKDQVQPGLIELSSSGTGFASGGKAVVNKEGIAFQC